MPASYAEPSEAKPHESRPPASWQAGSVGHKMKSRRFLWTALFFLVAYAAGWSLTAQFGVIPIKGRLTRKFGNIYPGSSTPVSVRVFVVSCPAPFILKSDCSVVQPGSQNGSFTAWYFVSPFGAWQIAESQTAWRH